MKEKSIQGFLARKRRKRSKVSEFFLPVGLFFFFFIFVF